MIPPGLEDAIHGPTATPRLVDEPRTDLIPCALSLLGKPVRDRVTGFKGMCSSITFDAYGCVQGLITPPVVDNKPGEAWWYDVKRIEVTGDRVMPAPDFLLRYGEERGGNRLPVPDCRGVTREQAADKSRN